MSPWPIQMIRPHLKIQVFPFESVAMSCPETPGSSKVRKPRKSKAPPKPRKPRAKKVETFLPLAIERGECWISIQLPIRTKSEANNFEHWRIKDRRKKQHNAIVLAALNPIKNELRIPCTVVLKRYGTGHLDKFENLPMSFKYIVDCIAFILTGKDRGRGDSDPRIEWRAEQEKSPHYGIKITFEF